jgi:membrane-bound serine protease (ClpP class)
MGGVVIERLDGLAQRVAGRDRQPHPYLLLLIGVYGLILEAGRLGPAGVVGAICLLMALYPDAAGELRRAGLIVLGVILIIAEVMSPSFGALGFGVISIVISSIILIDTGTRLRRVAAADRLNRGHRFAGPVGDHLVRGARPPPAGRIRARGTGRRRRHRARGLHRREGHVFVHSERWNTSAETPVQANQAVVVTGLDGLILKVRPPIEKLQEKEDV